MKKNIEKITSEEVVMLLEFYRLMLAEMGEFTEPVSIFASLGEDSLNKK